MTKPVGIAAAAVVVLGIAWAFNLGGIRATAPHGSVAALFDRPPAYPGYVWTRDGDPVGEFELTTIAGPDHCHWQDAAMMFIAWPPGTTATTSVGARMYVRDPKGVYHEGRYRDLLDLDATLPADARPTGHELAGVRIYVSPSDHDDAIYLVGRDGAERWPRVEPMGLCA